MCDDASQPAQHNMDEMRETPTTKSWNNKNTLRRFEILGPDIEILNSIGKNFVAF